MARESWTCVVLDEALGSAETACHAGVPLSLSLFLQAQPIIPSRSLLAVSRCDSNAEIVFLSHHLVVRVDVCSRASFGLPDLLGGSEHQEPWHSNGNSSQATFHYPVPSGPLPADRDVVPSEKVQGTLEGWRGHSLRVFLVCRLRPCPDWLSDRELSR